jgi:hypothetical protein
MHFEPYPHRGPFRGLCVRRGHRES